VKDDMPDPQRPQSIKPAGGSNPSRRYSCPYANVLEELGDRLPQIVTDMYGDEERGIDGMVKDIKALKAFMNERKFTLAVASLLVSSLVQIVVAFAQIMKK
jgi:hypothetical protein